MQSVNLLLISIHAPRTGSDQKRSSAQGFKSLFQSTLPARGVTAWRADHFREVAISIHAPRTGSDSTRRDGDTADSHFNPRSPHGERQILRVRQAVQLAISIHAPRTGSDMVSHSVLYFDSISIHAPRTGSDAEHTLLHIILRLFQSTLPARGATRGGQGGQHP